MHDVIVIGGGPAGLWLAYRLACDGFDTVVLDDRTSIGDRKICTGIVSPETFDRFQLPRNSILNDIQKMSFFSPSGSELEYVHPSILAHLVDRTAFDQNIAEISSAKRVEIRNSTRVKRIALRADRVEAETESVLDPQQRTKAIKARVAVIATGVNTRINKSLGLGSPTSFLNAAQAHIKVRNLNSTLCYIGRDVAPGAFGWLVPLNADLGRVGLMAEGNVAHYFEKLLHRTAEYIATPHDQIEMNVKPIAQGFTGRTYGHRVIAVGEAAGHVKTTTGGGIYYGMLCADLAAGVVAEALEHDRCGEGSLSRYEERWRNEIEQELRIGYVFRKAFARLSDRQLEKLFSLAQTNGILPLIRMTVKFDWHAETLRSLGRYATIQKILEIDSTQS